MINRLQTISRHDLEAKIVKRCRGDERFPMEFTSNPSAAFAKYLNVPAADLPRISVHREEPGSWHIVLPAKPGNVDGLSEQELEKVAGGVTPSAIVGSVMVSVGISGGSAGFTYVVSQLTASNPLSGNPNESW
jgi:hypothetical protein